MKDNGPKPGPKPPEKPKESDKPRRDEDRAGNQTATPKPETPEHDTTRRTSQDKR